MKSYELMYIIPAQTSDEVKEATIAKINAMIEKEGGKIDSVERLGNKKLAYEIQKKREGYYVLVNLTCEAALPNKVGAVLAITSDVLRFIFVAK